MSKLSSLAATGLAGFFQSPATKPQRQHLLGLFSPGFLVSGGGIRVLFRFNIQIAESQPCGGRVGPLGRLLTVSSRLLAQPDGLACLGQSLQPAVGVGIGLGPSDFGRRLQNGLARRLGKPLIQKSRQPRDSGTHRFSRMLEPFISPPDFRPQRRLRIKLREYFRRRGRRR